MNMNNSCSCKNCTCCTCRKTHFDWSAIIVAALIGVGISFLFTLFSLALGFTAFSITSAGATAFQASGFIGLVIAAVISMFIVGWVAGCLARPFCSRKYDGELYGLTAWCFTLILSILLAASSDHLIANTSAIVNKNTPSTAATLTVTKTVAKVTGLSKEASAEKNATVAAETCFVTFFIFFIGALISSFGGRCAVHNQKQARSD